MGILKNQTFNTILGLRDTQPLSTGGRNIASQTHVQGEGTNISVTAASTNFDLDGQTPIKYTDNLPR